MNLNTSSQFFLWDALLSWLKNKAIKYKVPLFTSLILGFLSYTFTFTNKLLNHDEAYSLFIKGATVSSGRWFLEMLDKVFPNLSMPWIYGVITISLISVSLCMIVSIFRIRSRLLQGLLAGSIIVFPALTGIFTFMFASSSYGLSFFLSVLAVWLVARWNVWAFLCALVCMVFSLAIYQSYVALAASLLVLLVIQLLLQDTPFPQVIRKGTVSLLFLILSLGIYFLSTKVVNWYLGTALSTYATDRIAFSIWELPQKAVLAYQHFFKSVFHYRFGLVPTAFSRTVHLAGFLFCMGLILVWVCRQPKKKWPQILLLILMLLLLPLAVNCMFLFIDGSMIHTLMLYSFSTIYILPVILIEEPLAGEISGKLKAAAVSFCVHMIPLCLALIITINVYVANIASLHLFLRYEIAYSFYSSLIADIKMMPEFDENSKLAVVGFYSGPDYYYTSFAPYIDDIIGTYGFVPSDYSKENFLNFYLDFQIPVVSDEECDQIAQTPEFQEMPYYPYYGSMKWFGDTLVIKVN